MTKTSTPSANSSAETPQGAGERLLTALTSLEKAISTIEQKLSTVQAANDDRILTLEKQLNTMTQQYENLNAISQQVANRLDENMQKLRVLAG